jgi:O-antigen ligase
MSAEPSPTLALDAAGRPGRIALTAAAALCWGLILLLAFAPLPLGSVWPLPGAVLGVAGAVLLAIAAVGELARPSPVSLRQLRVPLALAALVTVWIVVQTLPLGLPIGDDAPWDMAARIIGAAPRSISLDRQASLIHLLHLLTYAAVFLAAWRVAQDASRAALVLRAVATIGTAYSVYGLLVFADGNHTILWLAKWAYWDDLTSTFVNRNSYATFAGLTLLACAALLINAFVRRVDARSGRILLQTAIESMLVHGRWAALGLVLNGTALLFTHSRGGSSATLAGLLVLVALASVAPSLRGPWRTPFAILILAGAVALAAAGAGRLIDRVSTSAIAEDARGDLLNGTAAAIADHPWVGTGLGSFRYVYPAYQAPTVDVYANQAHDDYLESILELGLPAGLAFLAIPAILALSCVAGVWRRRRDALFPCLGAAASVLVGVHSVVDFSLQIPAVTLAYAALLGIGVAQSARTSERGAA